MSETRPAAEGTAVPDGTAVAGADGRRRCVWASNSADEELYHDTEWGLAVRDDRGVFERLSLEAFQSGLSWLVVLRKRDALRAAFADFDIATVAEYTSADVERLLTDTRLIRNRAKIEAVVTNARAALRLPGGVAELVWRHVPEPVPAPVTVADVPAWTQGSAALARELRRHGFRFVGPTTAYATMQAAGLVNDHLRDCFRRG